MGRVRRAAAKEPSGTSPERLLCRIYKNGLGGRGGLFESGKRKRGNRPESAGQWGFLRIHGVRKERDRVAKQI